MASFSERMGIISPRDVIQTESMTSELRNNLWDIFQQVCLADDRASFEDTTYPSPLVHFYIALWTNHYRQTRDSLSRWAEFANKEVRKKFFEAQWNEIYDLFEFVMKCTPPLNHTRDDLRKAVNRRLAEHLAGYRLVGSEFAPVVDSDQIAAIETALESPLVGVRAHLTRALELLSDRQAPDYANSIKESVSAVESICSAIVGKKATLGDALKKLSSSGVSIHGALERGWLAIYGYTSDEHGIRHAMQEEPDLSAADAVYFLASCSAFVGLLTEKAGAAGIELVAAA